MSQNISPAQKAELDFLNRMVNRLQDESFRLDHHPNVQQDLWRARKELKDFVRSLRKEGFNI